MKLVCTLSFLFVSVAISGAAQQIPSESTKAVITQRLGFDDVTVTCSRPNVKGRLIWGSLIRYGMVWRTGADYPTFIAFTDTTTVEGKPLPPGKYALYTIPNERVWTIIFSRNLGLWGSFGYKAEDDALRVEVKPEMCEFTETFTIGFADIGDNVATLTLQWEKVRVRVRLAVDTDDKVLAYVKEAITAGKANWRTYWQGGRYLLKHNGDAALAMQWVDKSIELEPNDWMNRWTKAQLLAARGDYASAVACGEKAIETGKQQENAQYFGYEATWKKDLSRWKRSGGKSK
jgi:hypothetical protein